MLRTIMMLAVFILLLSFTLSCRRNATPDEARALLAGEWQLIIASNCRDLGIASDKLLLNLDGKMEQHAILSDGQHYDSVTERWQYLPDNRIELNERFNVSRAEGNGGSGTEKRFEILIVQFTNPPSILLDPDKNCFYQKMRDK